MTIALVDWSPVPHFDLVDGSTYGELVLTVLVYLVLLAVVGALVRPGAGSKFRQGFTESRRKQQAPKDDRP